MLVRVGWLASLFLFVSAQLNPHDLHFKCPQEVESGADCIHVYNGHKSSKGIKYQGHTYFMNEKACKADKKCQFCVKVEKNTLRDVAKLNSADKPSLGALYVAVIDKNNNKFDTGTNLAWWCSTYSKFSWNIWYSALIRGFFTYFMPLSVILCACCCFAIPMCPGGYFIMKRYEASKQIDLEKGEKTEIPDENEDSEGEKGGKSKKSKKAKKKKRNKKEKKAKKEKEDSDAGTESR